MSLRRGLSKSYAGLGKGAKPIQALTLDAPTDWLTGEDITLSCERAMKLSCVNRCVELRSNTMAVLPAYVMNEQSKKRLGEHHLGAVLWGRANEAMTSFDYDKLMQVNRDLRGNAYAWIVRSAASGHPTELIPLPPDYVSLHLDEQGRYYYLFLHPKSGEGHRISPADMLHYKAFSYDGLRGVPILTRAAHCLSTAEYAAKHENAFYRNGARPSGVLSTEAEIGGMVEIEGPDGEMRSVSKKDVLRAEWNRVHAGSDNAFRIAVLDMGLKYQGVSLSHTDAQFVESAELRVGDICRFFGVPPHLVYAGKQSYQSNEQNALEYVKYTLQADVTQHEQEDSYKLLLPSERAMHLRVKREMKVFLRGDSSAQAAWYQAMREVSAYSPNDVRALEDLGPVEGGDARAASLNYVPLEHWAALSLLRAGGEKEQP